MLFPLPEQLPWKLAKMSHFQSNHTGYYFKVPVSRNPIEIPWSMIIIASHTSFLHHGAVAVAKAVTIIEMLRRQGWLRWSNNMPPTTDPSRYPTERLVKISDICLMVEPVLFSNSISVGPGMAKHRPWMLKQNIKLKIILHEFIRKYCNRYSDSLQGLAMSGWEQLWTAWRGGIMQIYNENNVHKITIYIYNYNLVYNLQSTFTIYIYNLNLL